MRSVARKAVGFNNMTVCNSFFDAQTFQWFRCTRKMRPKLY